MAAAPILRKIFYAPERALGRLTQGAARFLRPIINNVGPVVTPEGIVMRPPIEKVDVHVLLSESTDPNATAMGSTGTPPAPAATPAAAPAAPEKPVTVTREQAQKALDKILRKPSLSRKIITGTMIALGAIGIYGFSQIGALLGAKFLALGASLASIYFVGALVCAAPLILFILGTAVVRHFTFPLRRELKDRGSRAWYAVAQLAVEQGAIGGKKGIRPDSRPVSEVRGDIEAIDEICKKTVQDTRPAAQMIEEGKVDMAALREIVEIAPIKTKAIQKAEAEIARLEKQIPQLEAAQPKPADAAAAAGGAPAPEPAADFKVGNNEYIIIAADKRPISEGTSGKVFVVYKKGDPHKHPLALKVFSPNEQIMTGIEREQGRDQRQETVGKLRSRFTDEISYLRKLSGLPHIIPLRDSEGETPPLIIVMDYVADDLQTYAQKKGKMEEGDAAVIVRQICIALKGALETDATLIHRDLKPGNVLVDERAGKPHVLLVDFGTGKPLRIDSSICKARVSHTQSRDVMGTPRFITPEAILDGGSDSINGPYADMYALGKIFYFLMKGEDPLPEKFEMVAEQRQAEAALRFIDRKLKIGKMSPEAAAIVAKLLMTRSEKRRGKGYQGYTSYAEIIRDLDALINPAPAEDADATSVGKPAAPPKSKAAPEGEAIPIDEEPEPPMRPPRPGEVEAQGAVVEEVEATLPETPPVADRLPAGDAGAGSEPKGAVIDRLGTQYFALREVDGVEIVLDDQRRLNRLLSSTPANVEACLGEIVELVDHMTFTPKEAPALQELLAQVEMDHPELGAQITDAIAMLDELK